MACCEGRSGRALTTRLHPVLRLRVRGCKPLFPRMSSLGGQGLLYLHSYLKAKKICGFRLAAAFNLQRRCVDFLKGSTNALGITNVVSITQYPPICLGHPCGHHQGDEDKNKNICIPVLTTLNTNICPHNPEDGHMSGRNMSVITML